MGMWLLEMQILLSPRGHDLTHAWETKLILTYCKCAPDGGNNYSWSLLPK